MKTILSLIIAILVYIVVMQIIYIVGARNAQIKSNKRIDNIEDIVINSNKVDSISNDNNTIIIYLK